MRAQRWPVPAALAALLLGSVLAAPAANAQGAAGSEARARYEADLARCNSGNLPAPAREACIRDAGQRFDRAGGPPSDVEVPSNDGRATVVTPSGALAPVGSTDTATTQDGRATVVVPADRVTAPR